MWICSSPSSSLYPCTHFSIVLLVRRRNGNVGGATFYYLYPTLSNVAPDSKRCSRHPKRCSSVAPDDMRLDIPFRHCLVIVICSVTNHTFISCPCFVFEMFVTRETFASSVRRFRRDARPTFSISIGSSSKERQSSVFDDFTETDVWTIISIADLFDKKKVFVLPFPTSSLVPFYMNSLLL